MQTLSRWTTRWLLIGLLAAPLSASAATFDDPRLPNVRNALQSAELGRLDPGSMRALANHPLASWIEYAQLKHDLAYASPEQVRAYLNRYLGQPAAQLLRDAWLQQLDRRQDWPSFRSFYAGSDKPALQCADLAARLATGAVDAAWDSDAIALWSSTGASLPGDCDAPFATLSNRGKLTSDVRWKRIELAADAGSGAVMRASARGLPASDFAQAMSYAAFIDAPSMSASAWPKTDRSRRIAADGLERLAHRSPSGAEQMLSSIGPALQLNASQRGQVLYEVALRTVASYLPGSAARLAAVPQASYDVRLHEWQVREAMSRGDDATALRAIAAMDRVQRNDPRWQYFAARMRERAGDKAGAKVLYAQAARTATFHGFLAADRLNSPYAICALELQPSRADSARIAANPALVRALDLFRIDRTGWALIEWKQAITGMSDNERQLAVSLAHEAGWYDRALFTLGKRADGTLAPDELRLYSLRFPLNHARNVQDEAQRNGIDRAWVAAEIRAESGWMPNARSS
ncbi:MAG: lytic murein transglycosylase, partial [Lysobacteraceae bacterium]